MPTTKILFAHRWRLISDRLENIVRLPEASNKCPVRKFEAPSQDGASPFIQPWAKAPGFVSFPCELPPSLRQKKRRGLYPSGDQCFLRFIFHKPLLSGPKVFSPVLKPNHFQYAKSCDDRTAMISYLAQSYNGFPSSHSKEETKNGVLAHPGSQRFLRFMV